MNKIISMLTIAVPLMAGSGCTKNDAAAEAARLEEEAKETLGLDQ